MRCEVCDQTVPEDAVYCPHCRHTFDPATALPAAGRAIPETDGWSVAAFVGSILFFIPGSFAVALVCAVISGARLRGRPKVQGRGLLVAAVLFALMNLFLQAGVAVVAFGIWKVSNRMDSGMFASEPHANAYFEASSLQSLHGALQQYYLDQSVYPPPRKDWRIPTKELEAVLGKDQFWFWTPSGRMNYNSDGRTWFILASGKNEDASHTIDVSRYAGEPEDYPGRDRIYDPTNGASSPGAIWIVGPNAWEPVDAAQKRVMEEDDFFGFPSNSPGLTVKSFELTETDYQIIDEALGNE